MFQILILFNRILSQDWLTPFASVPFWSSAGNEIFVRLVGDFAAVLFDSLHNKCSNNIEHLQTLLYTVSPTFSR